MKIIERHRPDVVAAFAADRVYRMDVRQMAAAHRERGAYATLAAVPVPLGIAGAFRVIGADENGRITRFQEGRRGRRRCQPTRRVRMRRWATTCSILTCLPDCSSGHARTAAATSAGTSCLRSCAVRAFAYDCASSEIAGGEAARDELSGPRLRLEISNRRWPLHGERLMRAPTWAHTSLGIR